MARSFPALLTLTLALVMSASLPQTASANKLLCDTGFFRGSDGRRLPVVMNDNYCRKQCQRWCSFYEGTPEELNSCLAKHMTVGCAYHFRDALDSEHEQAKTEKIISKRKTDKAEKKNTEKKIEKSTSTKSTSRTLTLKTKEEVKEDMDGKRTTSSLITRSNASKAQPKGLRGNSSSD